MTCIMQWCKYKYKYVYVHVCMCVFVYVCVCMCVCMCAFACVYACVCTSMSICANVYVYVSTCTSMCVCVYVHVLAYTCCSMISVPVITHWVFWCCVGVASAATIFDKRVLDPCPPASSQEEMDEQMALADESSSDSDSDDSNDSSNSFLSSPESELDENFDMLEGAVGSDYSFECYGDYEAMAPAEFPEPSCLMDELMDHGDALVPESELLAEALPVPESIEAELESVQQLSKLSEAISKTLEEQSVQISAIMDVAEEKSVRFDKLEELEEKASQLAETSRVFMKKAKKSTQAPQEAVAAPVAAPVPAPRLRPAQLTAQAQQQVQQQLQQQQQWRAQQQLVSLQPQQSLAVASAAAAAESVHEVQVRRLQRMSLESERARVLEEKLAIRAEPVKRNKLQNLSAKIPPSARSSKYDESSQRELDLIEPEASYYDKRSSSLASVPTESYSANLLGDLPSSMDQPAPWHRELARRGTRRGKRSLDIDDGHGVL